MKDVLEMKPDVKRGDNRGSVNESYKIFGFRKDPRSSGVGEYAFKKKVDEKLKLEVREGVAHLCGELERMSRRIGFGMKESKNYKRVQEVGNIPSVAGEGGMATAFSVGTNYWSKSHKDPDFYFTTLSCLAPNEDDHDAIVYYFVFPAYEIAIPIRSGEIILFNPEKTHSCTNPRFEGSFIFSAYVASKTVLTQATATFKESESF